MDETTASLLRPARGPRSHGCQRAARWTCAVSVACVLALASTLTGCSGSSTAGGDTTCTEWLELDLPAQEALDNVADGKSNLSDEQEEIMKDALEEAGLATDEMNVITASINVLQFCAPDGTGTRPNAERPIAGALE